MMGTSNPDIRPFANLMLILLLAAAPFAGSSSAATINDPNNPVGAGDGAAQSDGDPTVAAGNDGVGGIELDPDDRSGSKQERRAKRGKGGGKGPTTSGATPGGQAHEPRDLWHDEGGAVGTDHSAPSAAGQGTLAPGDELTLVVHGATPDALTFVVIGKAATGLPFKGGLMIPLPEAILTTHTDANGSLSLNSVVPELPGLTSSADGMEVFVQVWIVAPDAPEGMIATNALSFGTP